MPSNTPTRRTALKATGGLAIVALAGCMSQGGSSPDETAESENTPGTEEKGEKSSNSEDFDEPEYDGWFDEVEAYDKTINAREEDGIIIEVGAGEDDLQFDPAAVWVDSGTTIQWEWTGDGGYHTVTTVDGSLSLDSELTVEEGHEYEVTATDEGITRYFCEPHDQVDMHGAIVVGPDIDDYVTEYDTTEPDYGDWFDETWGFEGTQNLLNSDKVGLGVGVGPTDGPNHYYSSPAIHVTPGTTVEWKWTGEGGEHSVTAKDEDFESELVDADEDGEYTFSHTFEEAGVHKYACENHRNDGMRGAVVVVESRL